jgi:hypothetical protein
MKRSLRRYVLIVPFTNLTDDYLWSKDTDQDFEHLTQERKIFFHHCCEE